MGRTEDFSARVEYNVQNTTEPIICLTFLVPTLRVGTHLFRRSASVAGGDAKHRGRRVPTQSMGTRNR